MQKVLQHRILHLLIYRLTLLVIIGLLTLQLPQDVPHHLDVNGLLIIGVPRGGTLAPGRRLVPSQGRLLAAVVADVGFVKRGAELSVWIPFGFRWWHSLAVLAVEMALGCGVTKHGKNISDTNVDPGLF